MHFGVAAPLAQAGALCLRGYSLLVILLRFVRGRVICQEPRQRRQDDPQSTRY